jgi:hypothetical protein
MASIDPQYIAEASRLVDDRIKELERLTHAEAECLPEVTEMVTVIAGRKASITVFRQDDSYELEGKTLVVVLAATPVALGTGAHHVERGLVFSARDPARRATERELQNSGG